MRCVFIQRFVHSDLHSGCAVTGANCCFSETSSQCAKQAPEDRINHYDPSTKVTEMYLGGIKPHSKFNTQ